MAQVAPMPVMIPTIAPSYVAAEAAHAPAVGMMPTTVVSSSLSAPDVSIQQQTRTIKQPLGDADGPEAALVPLAPRARELLMPESRTGFLAQLFAQSKTSEQVRDSGYNIQVSLLTQTTGTVEKNLPVNFRDLVGWRRELLHYNAPPYEEKPLGERGDDNMFSGAVLREPVTVEQQLRYASGSYKASSDLAEAL